MANAPEGEVMEFEHWAAAAMFLAAIGLIYWLCRPQSYAVLVELRPGRVAAALIAGRITRGEVEEAMEFNRIVRAARRGKSQPADFYWLTRSSFERCVEFNSRYSRSPWISGRQYADALVRGLWTFEFATRREIGKNSGIEDFLRITAGLGGH
jgi:hypothetical protein